MRRIVGLIFAYFAVIGSFGFQLIGVNRFVYFLKLGEYTSYPQLAVNIFIWIWVFESCTITVHF